LKTQAEERAAARLIAEKEAEEKNVDLADMSPEVIQEGMVV
jgi:hypothetical protein